MTTYKQTQFNFFTLLILAFFIVATIILKAESDIQTFFRGLFLFYTFLVSLFPMKIELDNSFVNLSWGWFNWPKKSFSLHDIVTYEEFYKIYWRFLRIRFSFGSHFITKPRLKIYAMNPYYYVKLSMKDGKTILVGTLSPKELLSEIHKRIGAPL